MAGHLRAHLRSLPLDQVGWQKSMEKPEFSKYYFSEPKFPRVFMRVGNFQTQKFDHLINDGQSKLLSYLLLTPYIYSTPQKYAIPCYPMHRVS